MICLLLPVCRRWSGGVAASRPEAFWRNFSKALLGARWRPQVGGFSQAGKPRLREARKSTASSFGGDCNSNHTGPPERRSNGGSRHGGRRRGERPPAGGAGGAVKSKTRRE